MSSVSHIATEDDGQTSARQGKTRVSENALRRCDTRCTEVALFLLSSLDHVAMDETPPSEDTIAGGHFAGVGDFPAVAKSPHKSPLHTQDLPFRADPKFSLR